MAVIEKSFDCLQDLLDHVQTAKDLYGIGSARRKDTNGFQAFTSWKETIRLANEGWEEGSAMVEAYASKFIDLLGSQLKIDEYFYDVSGQDFDLDRVLIGEPEAWLNTEQVEVKAPALQTLRLAVNIGASAAVSAETLKRKGAAIVALVALLERTRRSVEVALITRDCSSYGNAEDGFNFNLTVKEAGQSIDIPKLAFCLAHVNMLRRLQFAVMESDWKGMPTAYGYSSDFRKPEADIYIGCSHISNEVFLSEERTETWILEEIKKQGVELKGA